MRAFLALPVPEPALTALVVVQAGLPIGRAVPEENLHLTLVFLGEVSETALADLGEILSTTPLPQAELPFAGLGTFAEIERGLIFAAVEPAPALVALQAKAARAARAAGLDLPRRRFRPHVTLTRANRQPKGPARDRMAAALGTQVDIPAVTATEVVLYRSILAPGGARHDALAHYPLSPFS
ncbi:MAG: RNA 2',3'-cyclic phosphodiesterase [Roseicyclus sp.]